MDTSRTTQIKKIINCVFLLYFFIVSGCTSLHAYAIVLSTDYDGKAVLEKEDEVKRILEQLIETAGLYVITAYTRTAISHKVKKTKSTTHSFYVIAREGEETYQTLSYSATGKWATSEGAWTINTASDIASYEDYIRNENRWDVEEIETEKGINTEGTINNVLAKINSGVTYYFRAEVNKDDDWDNCNSALLETLERN